MATETNDNGDNPAGNEGLSGNDTGQSAGKNTVTAGGTTAIPGEKGEQVLTIDEFSKKSLELTIDSLKLYITIATFSFGGLLAIYNTVKNPQHTPLIYISLCLFVASVIVSIYTINSFINEVSNKRINIHTRTMRCLNWAAILPLVAGIGCGAWFIITQPKHNTITGSALMIQNGTIKVSGNLNSTLRIETDSAHKSKTFILDLK